MFEFSVSKDMKKRYSDKRRILREREREILGAFKEECFIGREVAVGNVATHLCLALIVKELKINVDSSRVVTTPDTIKH